MKKIKVTKNIAGQRIDKFLAKEFFSYSRGEIIRNIRDGNILVKDKKTRPSYLLKVGDKITFPSPLPSPKGRGGLVLNPELKIKIIYQDENVVVVNKPAGLQVHPDNKENKKTLVNWLVYKFPEIRKVVDSPSCRRGIDDVYTTVGTTDPGLRPGIVHRLDKDTSGVMVIARNQKAFEELKKLFKEHKVEKKYLAIVYGILRNKKGEISKPIARAATYKKQVIAGRKTKTKVREAVTEYKVLKELDNYSLLEVTPKTGRMHQIRVHLFSIGHPIVGDKLYKLKKAKLFPLKSSFKVTRHLLHAKQLFFHLGGKKYKFSARPPKDFADFLGFLDEGKIKS